MIVLYIILGLFLYVTIARVVYNFGELLFKLNYSTYKKPDSSYYSEYDGDDKTEGTACSIFFPITLSCVVLLHTIKFLYQFPIKLGDFISNPKNYKFKIEIKRK